MFVDWIYTKEVPISNTMSRLLDLYDLYFLATKLMLVELMDAAMDGIQTMSSNPFQQISMNLLAKVYSSTPAGSKLRVFGVRMYLYGLLLGKVHQL